MREIKFRGLDKRGVWHYGFFWISPDGCYWIKENGADFQVIPKTVGQFTGLSDKQGKEIYQGDICKSVVNAGDFTSLTEDWVYEIKDIFDAQKYIQYSKEVIGNIYENHDLLK